MKGIFYSVIVIMMIAPIVMYIVLYLGTTETQVEEISAKIKGDKMISYSKSVEQDLVRVLDITAKISISAAVSYIDMNGIPLNNSNDRLIEIMENGTIYGSEFALLDSNSLKDWIAEVEAKSNNYGFHTKINVIYINITPYDSFNLLLSALVSVNITDNRAMKIYKIYNQTNIISIEGLEDPLYGLETNGLLKRKFTRGTINSTEDLDNAVANHLYINSTQGASFLDRLEGSLTTSSKYSNMTSNQIGLETIVYLPDLSGAGLHVKTDQTNVDYLYFNESTFIGYPVNNTGYSWLKIDEEHASIYNVDLIK